MPNRYHFASKKNAQPPPMPECCRCGKTKRTRLGAFCGSRCAAKFGIEYVVGRYVECDHCHQWQHPDEMRNDCCIKCGRKRTTT